MSLIAIASAQTAKTSKRTMITSTTLRWRKFAVRSRSAMPSTRLRKPRKKRKQRKDADEEIK